LAGLLDGAAASLLFIARGNRNPAVLFRFIASGVYGPAALTGGARMAWLGLFLHLLIACSFVAAYFGVCSVFAWPLFHPLVSALVYGLLVWALMNLVVVPLSRTTPRPFSLAFALVNVLILIVAIGAPAAWGARLYFL
jgi:hypothetical protein